MFKTFIVVMNRHRQNTLRALLSDDIIIQNLLNFAWGRDAVTRTHELGFIFLADDIHAQLYTLITNEYVWACNQLTDLMLALAAEGAVKCVFCI